MTASRPSAQFPAGYEVVRRAIAVESLRVEMVVVENPNRLAMNVSVGDFAEDERFPYWAELWPSALALGHFLSRRGSLEGCRVIELGCGMGFAGVVAALLGAQVLFTDFEEDALAFAVANHALNLGRPGESRLVDWREPPRELEAPLVLGADVLYERRFVDPLLDTLGRMVVPGGKALIAEPDRQVASGALVSLEDRGFARELHLEEVQVGAATYPIWIHELVRCAGRGIASV